MNALKDFIVSKMEKAKEDQEIYQNLWESYTSKNSIDDYTYVISKVNYNRGIRDFCIELLRELEKEE